MKFIYSNKREAQNYAQRSVAMGAHGMAASSQQLATLSGYKILSKGGNAVDAAVSMLSTLSVVEPFSVGLGGDAFGLICMAEDGDVIGLNGSGRAPGRADISTLGRMGLKAIPERGILSATVPGALHGWYEAIERYGTMKPADLFEDAIYYGENGFPVTEVIAGEWKDCESLLVSHEGSAKIYLINGKAPGPGSLFRNKDIAATYRLIADEGIDAFYSGDICDKIIRFSDREGGLFTRSDFEGHTSSWVKPLATDYRGYTVFELPPNGQGVTALEMLNIMEGFDIGGLGHNSPEFLHLLIEAKKLAFYDRDRFIADPRFSDVPVKRLISKEYADRQRQNIDPHRASHLIHSTFPQGSETVYVTAVDKDRNAASFISSIFMPFGSGMVVDNTGIILHNRGHSFSMKEDHRNRIEPLKRPMHTIIPAMLFKEGRFLMSFGVMGGDMQPQGHVQFLINLIDFKMNIQEAVDAPRVRHLKGQKVYFEDGIPHETVSSLEKRGHESAGSDFSVNQVGGGQAIYLDPVQDILLGASDRRKDGLALGY